MFDKLSQGNRLTPRRVAAAAAVTLVLALAGGALAQPAGGHGGAHPGMMGGGDEVIGHLIAHAQAQLNLNTSQKLMFDNAVAQTKAARDTGRTLHQKAKDALAAELAKPEPDLAAVAAAGDSTQQQGNALRHQVRDSWLQLYATFTPDQKAVVRDLLQKDLARMDSFRQKMMDRMHGAG